MMRKFTIAIFALALFCASNVLAQNQSAPTLRIVTEDPNLPSDLYYGNVRVKPLRLRPGTNQRITVDDADFFVQQQYIDFLGRFPDPSGFAFWTKQVTDCGNDINCIDRMRVNTSQSFFMSTEFQETGYYVYRFYRATLNRMPRYAELMAEKQRVAGGVVVLAPGWEQKLEANKRAYADLWVTRADFAPFMQMTPETFADSLFANVGVTPNPNERLALVNELKNGGSRAVVLRKILETEVVSKKEYNSAFVLMQYFGYLRRNPDDAPDGNMSGYNFWLKEVNGQGQGRLNDYSNMVRAFVVAGEFRDRF
ncbi:MAG: hypothetical protein H0V27_12650 [Pyrinomonadaceae bacterium]|nr:hypothetical protein [Pyrinomonadaceae bacterium]